MSWYVPFAENIKKRACRYLLQRYLGQYLEEKLTLDQLTVDLYKGTGSVSDVTLDCQAINELCTSQGLPIEVLEGRVSSVSVSIPWSAPLSDDSFVDISGLTITIRPKARTDYGTSVLESMWSSMSSSMQLARDCLEKEGIATTTMGQPLEGLEHFAQTIDSILTRIKVRLTDLIIKLEHCPNNGNNCLTLQINIKNLEYFDEAGSDSSCDENEQNKYVYSAFSNRHIVFEGISLYTNENILKYDDDENISQNNFFTSNSDSLNDGTASFQSSNNIYFSCEMSSLSKESMIQSYEEKDDKEGNFQDNEFQNNKTSEIYHEPILFGQLLGRQEVQIKMKQSESIVGPKVQLDISMGSFTCFITPRQLHTLIEIISALSSPQTDNISKSRKRMITKPMTSAHFKLIEEDLQTRLKTPNTGLSGLSNVHGWSAAQIDDDAENDSEFQPFRGFGMSDSIMSNNSTMSMTSSIGSSISQTSSKVNNQNKAKESLGALHTDNENGNEISHYNFRLASVAVIILHEDVLTTSSGLHGAEQTRLCQNSIEQLQTLAQTFFQSMGLYSAFGAKDFAKAISTFNNACGMNHIRFLAAPVILEGYERKCGNNSLLEMNATAAKLVLHELRPKQKTDELIISLLEFSQMSKIGHMALITKPQLKIKFKMLQKKSSSNSTGIRSRRKPPRSELSIYLEPCTCELDISIIDRISAFLVTPSWTTSKIFSMRKQSSVDINSSSDSICEYKINCDEIQVKLRFPVVDLRPKHDPLRPPWWDRYVHPDFAFVTLKQTSGRISSLPNNGIRYELQCQEAIIDYVEADCGKRIPIAHAGSKDKLTSTKISTENEADWPRLVLDVFPTKQKHSLESNSDTELPPIDPMLASIGGALRNNMQIKEPSPFSAKRIIHKSDTSHLSDESDELIIPGTRPEMKAFCNMARSNSLMQIELSLQYVTIQLSSKHLYEKIYNHINTDLLLWEPSASFLSSTCTGSIMQDIPMFSMCKSGIHYDSESSAHDSDSDSNSGRQTVFYSICDRKLINGGQQHNISFNLEIKQGLLTMCTPVRDASNHVIPGQQGEFVIRAGELAMFSVSGFNGDPELGFVCVQAKNAEIFHSGLHSISETTESLRLVDCTLPSHLQKTIFLNSEHHHRNTEDILSRDMVTVALRIQANHESKLKHIRTAIGVQEAMLMHRFAPSAHTWLTQLIDLFDVQDLPVQGYEPSNVITEIHLHVWDSAIEYRPLHMLLRARVTLGTFSMSSNIIAQSTGINLRFMAEDCTLQIADLNHLVTHNIKSALKDLNYVSVVELGLFELSLRLNEKATNSCPRVDLRASNNALQIRTCADSGRALAHLIAYLAEEGDLQSQDHDLTTPTSCVQPSDQLLLEDNDGIPATQTKKLEEKVNELMAEAMLESLRVSTMENESDVVSKGVEVFFFPDEAKESEIPVSKEVNTKVASTITSALNIERKKKLSTGDDFCIVGDEVGVGIYPKNGHPEVRWLTKEPIHIVEHHFAIPTSKTDLLKAPRDFPMALFRYTLCEVTLTWYMYGGNDFEITSKTVSERQKVVTIDERGLDTGKINSVRYSIAGSKNISLHRETEDGYRKLKVSKNNSGVNRKENVLVEVHVNKVRFTHETYPDQTSYASRQVLLIGDLEIRDRLEISNINKLLYQQSSEQRPRQSNANIMMIKATHMRPDPHQAAQECSLRISLLPLRLNIDQDTLLFLIQFFSELSGSPIDMNKAKIDTSSSPTSRHSTPTHQIPVMTVEESLIVPDPEKLVSENLMLLLDDQVEVESNVSDVKSNSLIGENVPIYFRSIVFSPDVPIRLDYNGKRVELSHGPLAGLLMGLGQLECSELTLRRITHKHGILGVEKLLNFLMQQWLQDIKKRQLPSLLGGIGPIHSIVQLFQGIRDLFWLPIEQYQKDGRIVRGLQRGANSFTACTALAALQITTRIIHLIQATAETAFDMVSPGPSVKRGSRSGKKRTRRGRPPIHPPQDIREGVANAYQLVIEGLGDTASNLVHVASVEHSHKGMSGAVGGVLRQLPPTVVAPLVIASQATQHVLGGVTSQLVPDARIDAKQKWRLDDRQ